MTTSPEQPTVPLPEQLAAPQPSAPSYPAQPQVQQQSYQAQQSYPTQPAAPTTVAQTNTFALVSIILAFIQPIAAIVFGHMGMSQIKRNGDGGRGLALAGLIIGYIYVALMIAFVLFYVSMVALMIGSMGSFMNELDHMGSLNDLSS
ncbi:MAG: DUF4190 domain-containing protein [Actinobacteria bacterium]|nr:DUF4190 domain-containing protein [Actinomycetota bacterium]